MAISLSLYRRARWLVIWTVAAVILVQTTPAQTARGTKTIKGPRALGLLELPPNGKAHLIPVAILIDGQFYDAGAYKASPVPMALWSETVYEGIRTGVSQGLFTVTGALENQNTHEWIAEGSWQLAGSVPTKSAKASSSEPRGLNDDEGPPVLRHAGPEKPKAPDPTSAPPAPSSTEAAAPPAPQAAPAPASPAASSAPAAPPEQEDKDRPVLHRGRPAAKPPEPLSPPPAKSSKATMQASVPPAASKVSQVQLIPAISDANGPQAYPYTYDMKPEEDQRLRPKMLALAADEVRTRAAKLASETIGASEPGRTSRQRKSPSAKPGQPSFEGLQLRVFDLSSSNEPVLVLTANARLPHSASEKDNVSPDLQYMITLVGREDINGDFHRAFSSVTDSQHLDATPRIELIDAVDADGDGRGELLFREVSDGGSAFVIYRVVGDQLYALFRGSPSE